MHNNNISLEKMTAVMDEAVEELKACGGVVDRIHIFSEGDGIQDCYEVLDPWSGGPGSLLCMAYASALAEVFDAVAVIRLHEIRGLNKDQSTEDCPENCARALLVHSMLEDCEKPYLFQHYTCSKDGEISLGERCFQDSISPESGLVVKVRL